MSKAVTKECIILLGIPGAGKSSFYQAMFRDTHLRINLDMLGTRNREWTVLEGVFESGMAFVVDNTNVSKEKRERYIPTAKEKGYKVIGYIMNVEYEDSRKRNSFRTGRACVPEVALQDMAKKYEAFEYDEGFDEIYLVDLLPGASLGQFHFKITLVEKPENE